MAVSPPDYWSVNVNQKNLADSVIPGLTRNPVVHFWIPAFAGMTWLFSVFDMTAWERSDGAERILDVLAQIGHVFDSDRQAHQ